MKRFSRRPASGLLLLDRLATGDLADVATLVVAAHPDDETLGLGARLHRLGRLVLVHVTDGAPVDPSLGENDPPRLAYRARRASELAHALARAGVDASSTRRLGVVDQQAAASLPTIARRLAMIVSSHRPALVVTHAYEGGHPDHDATAVATRAALELARSDALLAEFAGYHASGAGLEYGTFLASDAPTRLVLLDAEARAVKASLLACFASQQEVVARFPTDRETFRLAPPAEFETPPHEGPLGYEREGLGRFDDWRRAIGRGLAELGLGGARWR